MPNKKNGGRPPFLLDERIKYVAVGCGECYECRRQKSNAWRVRLHEEIRSNKQSYFITFTFDNESLKDITKQIETTDANAIATYATRHFLERWRKKYKKSLKHWFITELGEENDRIHIHGIIFSENEITQEELQKYWKYGIIDIGAYCNDQTINYIVKYMTKIDIKHKHFKSIILASAGLGKKFLERPHTQMTYKYKKGETPEFYELRNGQKVALPIYYRNKLYTEAERERMWRDRLDKHTIWVNGIKCNRIDTAEGEKTYYDILACQQQWNNNIGYGNRDEQWKKEQYNIDLNALN